MSGLAATAGAVSTPVPSALTDVQSRVVALQQRIAAITGRAAAGTTASTGATTSTTFASSLALAQAQLDGTSASSTGSASSLAGLGSSGTSGSSATGSDVVAAASAYLGTPYQWGGTDPDTGLDCSGLVQRALADVGIDAPRTAAQQATLGTEVPSLAQAQPGDLVVLDGGHHIGIYVGDGRMLHAPKTGDVVKVSKVWETPTTIRRVTSDTTSSAASAASALSALRAAVLGTTSTLSTGLAGSTGSLAASALVALGGTSSASTSSASASTGASRAAAYQPLFDAAEARYGLPDGLLSAVASVESGYDAGATSGAGAQGLMQLMPGTARELGVDATDPAQAVDGAARLLRSHLARFGSTDLALAAYNAGPGNVLKYGGVPPFSETRAYVRKVSAAMAS